MRVLSLASDHLSNDLIAAGKPLGIEVTAYPAFFYTPQVDTQLWLSRHNRPIDFLIVTSRIAVALTPETIFNQAKTIVCVGNSTKATLRALGVTRPIDTPARPSMQGIQDHLSETLSKHYVLYPRSSDAMVPVAWFQARTCELHAPVLYIPTPRGLSHLNPSAFQWIIVSSGQIVRQLIETFPNLNRPIVCIGPQTEAALPADFQRVVSPSPSATDILETIKSDTRFDLGDPL